MITNINYCYLDDTMNAKFADLNYASIIQSDYRDPDAESVKLYKDMEFLLNIFDKEYCENHKLDGTLFQWKICPKNKFNLITDEQMRFSTDYIGPSRAWLVQTGDFTYDEIGNMLVRSRTIGGHLLWPVHRVPTINTSRGGRPYFDRIDITFAELRNYFLDEKGNSFHTSLQKIFNKEAENSFFSKFKDKGLFLNGFENYIDYFKLNAFVEEENEYKVLDLEFSELEHGKKVYLENGRANYCPCNWKVYVKNNLSLIQERNKEIRKLVQKWR